MSDYTMSHVITDNPEAIIDRRDTQLKLDRLETYLKRVQSRIKQLNKQLQSCVVDDETQALVEKGLESYDLKTKYSKTL